MGADSWWYGRAFSIEITACAASISSVWMRSAVKAPRVSSFSAYSRRDELATVEERHAQRGERAARDNEWILAVGLVPGRVVEHHALAGTGDVVDQPLRSLARAREG